MDTRRKRQDLLPPGASRMCAVKIIVTGIQGKTKEEIGAALALGKASYALKR